MSQLCCNLWLLTLLLVCYGPPHCMAGPRLNHSWSLMVVMIMHDHTILSNSVLRSHYFPRLQLCKFVTTLTSWQTCLAIALPTANSNVRVVQWHGIQRIAGPRHSDRLWFLYHDKFSNTGKISSWSLSARVCPCLPRVGTYQSPNSPVCRTKPRQRNAWEKSGNRAGEAQSSNGSAKR